MEISKRQFIYFSIVIVMSNDQACILQNERNENLILIFLLNAERGDIR